MTPRLPRAVLGAVVALALLTLSVLLGAASPWAGQPVAALTNCDVADASLDGEELAFLTIINDYRASKGAPALRLSDALTRAAHWMAAAMAANNYFSHTDSLGRHSWTRTVDCGYPIGGGENLAAGGNRSTARSAFELFQGSPAHNDNMLLADYTEIGIARVYRAGSTYGWYWATNFGTVRPAAAPPPAAAAAAAPGAGTGLTEAALARVRGDGDRDPLAAVFTRGLSRMLAAHTLAEARESRLRASLGHLAGAR